jgi:peptidoglycan/xylan/chitin deacetylase (PgdA/CDA1 family)
LTDSIKPASRAFVLLLGAGLICGCRTDPRGAEFAVLPPMETVPVGSSYRPDPHLCTWKGDKAAAYTITFDDTRGSHYRIAAPELKIRGLVGTFNLNTQGILNWDPWEQIRRDGNEIASHTYSHARCTELTEPELRAELERSIADLFQNIHGIDRVPSFAYPYGAFNESVSKIVLEYFTSARAATEGTNPPDLQEAELSRLNALWVHAPYDLESVNRRLDETVAVHHWAILIFHSVGGNNESDQNTIPISLFRLLLDSLKARVDSVWIDTQGEIVDYIRARRTSTVSACVIGTDAIEVTVSNPVPGVPVPMSVRLNLPVPWIGRRLAILAGDGSRNSPQAASGSVWVGTMNTNTSIRLVCLP